MRHRILVLVALLALVAAIGAGGAVPGDRPAVSSQVTASPTTTPTGVATLEPSVFTLEQGAWTTVVVHLERVTRATIMVGGEGADYTNAIGITDVDGDGTVPLLYRTGSVGMQATRFRPANEVDDYHTIDASPDPDGLVPVGEYPLRVFVGHGMAGEPTDVGTVVVTEPAVLATVSIATADVANTLRAESDQVLRGTSDGEAGRTLTVRLESTGEHPFVASAEATIGADGTWQAMFDLSGVEPPATATATVLVNGTAVAGPVDVEIVAEATPTTADGTNGGIQMPGQPGFGAVAGLLAVMLVGWNWATT